MMFKMHGHIRVNLFFCDIVWVLVLCNQHTMCPLFQNIVAKINMRGLNASLYFDHSFIHPLSFLPQTTSEALTMMQLVLLNEKKIKI